MAIFSPGVMLTCDLEIYWYVIQVPRYSVPAGFPFVLQVSPGGHSDRGY